MANIQDSATRKMEKTKHPGIYRRGNRYVIVYRDPQGRQRKQFAETLSQAKDLKAMLRADVRRGEYRMLSRVGFADYARDWIETYRGRTSRGVGEGSRDDYRDALEGNAIPFFGNARLPEIEPRDLKKFAASLEGRGLKPSSIKKLMAPVKCLLADAVEEGLIRSNPAAGLRIAQATGESLDEVETVKALSEDDLRRLLEHLPEAWRFFFDFLSQTGLRIGEAIELRHSDVKGNWLRVSRRYYRGRVGRPKGRKTRSVPMSRELAQQVWALRKDRRAAADDLVFTSAKGLRIDPPNVMSRVLKPAAIEAGLG
jgi:integrase